jgi:exonuclease I
MPTYDLVYLMTQFGKLFPEIALDRKNVLYRTSSKQLNTLSVEFRDKSKPTMIFVYNDRNNYKLMSKACYDEEEEAILKLRTELTKVQKTLRDERRKKNI